MTFFRFNENRIYMDERDYKKIGSLTKDMQDQMMKLEKALVKHVFCTNKQLCEILDVTSDRQVQKIIKQLNDCYGHANHISSGRKHILQDNEKNLAFPDKNYYDSSDKDLLNNVLKLASIFDGAIPLKAILDASNLRSHDLDKIINKFSSVMDVQLKGDEAKLIADLYKAIDCKSVVSFRYPQLEVLYSSHKRTNNICVSPYFIGRYNNKWFLIGAVMNTPKKQETRYPWSVFPLQRILKESGGKENVISYTDDKYKPIDINRIKNYYKSVMGFYVPVKPNEPFNEKLTPLNVQLRLSDRTMHFLEENPLHSSQKIDRENHLLEITVVENPSLYKTLLSLGTDIEVLEPESVRAEMHKRLTETLKLYE